MAELTLTIAGRSHRVACRDGGEAELTAAAALLDEQANLVAGLGGGEARVLLLAGLLIADRLREVAAAPGASPVDPALTARLAQLAERAEALADRLENAPPA